MPQCGPKKQKPKQNKKTKQNKNSRGKIPGTAFGRTEFLENKV